MVFDGLIDPASLEAHACSEALALARDLNLLSESGDSLGLP